VVIVYPKPKVGLMGETNQPWVAYKAMPTGIMRANKAGTIERDYRETGGFLYQLV